jgi:hypothetical protein
MASLTQQIEELEREYAYEQRRANEFAEQIDDLNRNLAEQIDDLNRDLADRDADLEWFREFEEWVAKTYPGARVAFDAKRRLDEASVGAARTD